MLALDTESKVYSSGYTYPHLQNLGIYVTKVITFKA
jgi:hypothetical protein